MVQMLGCWEAELLMTVAGRFKIFTYLMLRWAVGGQYIMFSL